jgi:SAM-dependent methyltransferase
MSMIEKLLSVPRVRRWVWGLWYPFLTKRLRKDGVVFLNYAFEEEGEPLTLELEDEPNRACIQLYHHVASQVELKGKDVLEVSCGHGGGAEWLTRTLLPSSYIGMDLNLTGVHYCQQKHQHTGLKFVQGDAQALPFRDASFDAVINVEASHCYPDFGGFLSEVERVLKPGGHFLYADFRFKEDWAAWDKAIKEAPLELVNQRDIGAEVLRGMRRNAAHSEALVRTRLPKFMHQVGRDFAGVPGSKVYVALETGELAYRSYLLRKL